MPVVEGSELVNQVHESRDLTLGVVSHDLLGGTLGRDGGVGGHLVLNKALQVRLQRAIGNSLVVRVIGSEELKVVTRNRVVRVMKDRVKVLVDTGPLLAISLIHKLRVPEGAVVDNIVQAILVNTTQDVVECAVFQQDPNNILNLVLQVGNGLLGTRLVAKGLLGVPGNNGTQSTARQAQDGQESVGLHD